MITHPYGAVVTPSSETTAACGIDGLEIQRKYYPTAPYIARGRLEILRETKARQQLFRYLIHLAFFVVALKTFPTQSQKRKPDIAHLHHTG